MKVKELMSTNIACIREDTPVGLIAMKMRKDDIGCIPVCSDAGHVKGVVTDRDLVLRVLAKTVTVGDSGDLEDIDGNMLTASDIMSKDPVTVSPDQNIHDAALLFSAYKIRRLPVTEASRIVGMLSLGDVAAKPVYIDEAGDALSAISIAASLPVES
ncbi:MAG: CBS domain-containing protein [Bacillota bacterium]|nr:CBS domain-containing protein [Bacillota bacterium]